MELKEATQKCKELMNKALEEGNLKEAKLWKEFAEHAEIMENILEDVLEVPKVVEVSELKQLN